ncbi:hypothetical protein LOCC1_G000456 [Lachnellula occidentalis]|uniref:Uncharacterized protein n=1 Tax=Lachnellula occidentalis TaxID=215460 RepID=A0A8H8S7F9_9HELO|nr:hypothetical protein LOCC1_G000456 [Lachnellula occidentalis]
MFKLPQVSSKWKWPKFVLALMVVELGGAIAALALFGIAEPDLYRTKLWQVGADNGFNSSPKTILYAYANYRKIPSIPFVWSHTLTEYNVAISVLCTFIMIVKWVMYALHIWYPLLATVTNIIITVLWIVSVYGQAGPDHSDPKHPSSTAWYINKSCSYAKPAGVLFLVNTIQGIWSMIPSASERALSKIEIDDMQSSKGKGASDSPASDYYREQNWEMKSHPKASSTPYTPRTLAFNTLDRQLPLRAENHGARFA